MRSLLRRISHFALGILCCSAVLAAVPTHLRLTVTPTASGVINTKFRDGNDGTPAIPLTWNASCIAALPVQFTQGTAASVDLSACLAQPAGGLSAGQYESAEIALEIIAPHAGLATTNRYYKAYPGIPFCEPVGVLGGAYPFTYELTAAPAGMTIGNALAQADYSQICWTNPTTVGSPHTVTVRVTDQAGTQATVSYSLTVTTTGFLFVDEANGHASSANGGGGTAGTGTLSNPFVSYNDVYAGAAGGSNCLTSKTDATNANAFVYFRAGTYTTNNSCNETADNGERVPLTGNFKPKVWMAYPGETVTLDVSGAAIIHYGDNAVGYWYSGFSPTGLGVGGDYKWVEWDSGPDDIVFFDNHLPAAIGVTSTNPAFVMSRHNGVQSTYQLYSGNTFAGANNFELIELYDSNKIVVEHNTVANLTNNSAGFYFKESATSFSVRHNSGLTGNTAALLRVDNYNSFAAVKGEASYNLFKTTGNPIILGTTGGVNIGTFHEYRNTWSGGHHVVSGPTAGTIKSTRSVYVHDGTVTDGWNIAGSFAGTFTKTQPLSATSGLIDVNGLLTGADRTSYLAIRGHEIPAGAGSAAFSLSPDGGVSGVSLSGSNLLYSGTGTGTGIYRIRASRSGFTADTSALQVTASAVPVSDTTAPTIPTGCTATGGSGTVTIACDASSDPYVSEAGSGVDEYDVRLASSVVGTLTGQSHGLSQALTQTIIGASDGTPSSIQTGADWALSFGGAGIVGTADQILFRGAQVTGNAFSTVKVNSLTSAATGPSTGLIARESTAANSAEVACRYSEGVGVRLTYRTGTGTTRSNGSAVAAALPLWLKLDRTGDLWTCSYSADGGAWIVVDSTTKALLSTLYQGIFITSSTAATNATASLTQLNINNVARISYTHTTGSGGSYTVRARDVSDNNSAYSTAVTGTPSGPSDTAGPTIVTQPTGASGGPDTINWNLGAWSDPSGIRGYIPSLSTTLGGTYVDQPEQVSNLYAQTGLTAGATRYLKSKAVDTLGNVSSASSAASATTAAAATLLFSDLWSTTYTNYPYGQPTYPVPWYSSGDPGCTRVIDSTLSRDAPSSFSADQSAITPKDSHCMIVYRGPTGPSVGQYFTPGVEYWMGFSVRPKSPWTFDTVAGAYTIVWQMHGQTIGTANNPMATIDPGNGTWRVHFTGATTNNKPYTRTASYVCGAVELDKWVDWVFDFKFGNPGFWKIWKNGELCVDDVGINYYLLNDVGPYTTLGLYHGWSTGPATPVRHVNIDQFRVGRALDGVGYAEVAPR